MYRALYIDDERSPFVERFLDELKKQGIQCDFWEWCVEHFANDGFQIDFKKLSVILSLEELHDAKDYDLMIFDIMMPPMGMDRTNCGLLTGIRLHENLLIASSSIKKLKTFFITDLHASLFAEVEQYTKDVGATLLRKENPEKTARTIAESIIAANFEGN
jgi:CheY-like chemotaxis protein